MAGTSLSRNTPGAVGAGIILWGLIIAMLIFTSIRTIHLLQLTFPPDQQYVAYLGLAAFDVGVLGWFFYATQKARGAPQRAVAYGMIFVCAGGVILATIADFFYQASINGVASLPPQLVTVGIWGVIIVVCLNFLAGIIVHLVDPVHLQRSKEEQLHDKIIAAAHSHMDTMTDAIAPQIAEILALEWKDRITAELVGKLPQGTHVSLPAAAHSPAKVVQGSGQALPDPKPERKEKEPVQMAQASTVDGYTVSSILHGVKSIIKGDRGEAPAQEPQPVKKELPPLRHSYATMPHHRTRPLKRSSLPPASPVPPTSKGSPPNGADEPKK